LLSCLAENKLLSFIEKQVGAPTVHSAFIARSGELSPYRHIHVMSIHVFHVFHVIYVIHDMVCHFMLFM
jgi:hypothetical protein